MQFGYGDVRIREKAEEALSAQMKLTAMWEIRARQKGWREKVAKSNAQTQGKTNYTRLQSKNNLQKAHNGWLLPLQMHMGGIATANKNDIDQHAVDTVCALNSNSGVSFRYFMCKKVLECLMFVC
ncbi:hypothetical protein E1A91_A13G138200v1 [Gossypium mustelinum]|uniref:Uncharacterized protein n=1 Tax=Gossypium mustelinum TaxID=34275 RepID=A0A5D2WHR7_GOSMU|nr:hypothetical protein E1A91_A13G138200v1 [Gossypium mustelinum]